MEQPGLPVTRPTPTDPSLSAELAALFVSKGLAAEPVDEEGLLEEGAGSARARTALWAHSWRRTLAWPRHAALAALLLLTIVEVPAWCSEATTAGVCRRGDYYTFGWDIFGSGVLLGVETAILLLLLADLLLWRVVLGPVIFWRIRRGGALHVALVLATMADILVAAALLPDGRWRLSPYLRSPLIITYDTALRRELESVLRSLPEYFKVLLMLGAFLGMFAWFSCVLFTNDGPEGPYFRDFSKSFWSLQVLLTTNNFPDVMLKGYTEARAYCIFFIVFLVLGLFLLLQVVIAVVYNGYIRQQEQSVQQVARIRERHLDTAFRILDEHGRGWLLSEQLSALLAALSRGGNYGVQDEARQALIFAVLDNDGSGMIERDEFGELARVLYLRFEPLRVPWLEKKAPRVWRACRCERLRSTLGSKNFEVFIDLIICVCAAISIVETWPFLVGETSQKPNEFTWDNCLDIGLTLLFMTELVLKILLFGWSRYWSTWQNCFDATVTLGAAVAIVVVMYPNGYTNYFLIKIAVLLRFFRIFRIFGAVPAFQPIFTSMAAVAPGAHRAYPLLVCGLLTFDVLGCDLFGGCITTDPSSPNTAKLAPTAFAQAGYFPLNFNDRAGGAVTLFACLVMNNWSTYVEAYMATAGSVAWVFFTLWWIGGNLLGLNLVTSVVIDAFVDKWGQLHSTTNPEERREARHIAFDAGVVTGTTTGLTGRWTAQLTLGSHVSLDRNIRHLVAPAPASLDSVTEAA